MEASYLPGVSVRDDGKDRVGENEQVANQITEADLARLRFPKGMPASVQTVPPDSKSPKPKKESAKRAPVTNRPLHVWAFIGVIAVLAYVLLALGWLVGAIGDSLYSVGKEMHESKWNIR